MKQLKFFTRNVDILRATQADLASRGIALQHLHTFARDDEPTGRQDLLLLSQDDHDELCLKGRIKVFVFLALLGTVALAMQWISFPAFALLFILCFGLYGLLYRCFPGQGVNKRLFKKVYYLVVDVDEREEALVEGIAKKHPGLFVK